MYIADSSDIFTVLVITNCVTKPSSAIAFNDKKEKTIAVIYFIVELPWCPNAYLSGKI